MGFFNNLFYTIAEFFYSREHWVCAENKKEGASLFFLSPNLCYMVRFPVAIGLIF